MRSADEVAFMDTFYGASLAASGAVYALIVIDSSKIVFYGYCARGANLFALSAGNTAILADLANLSSL